MLNKFFVDKIEEQMLPFMNLVENFSKTDDDIINVFDRANQYMTEPLRKEVNDFVMDARLYADVDASFTRLIKRMKGTKLSEVFDNLWLCSKHNSNYEEVIKDIKRSIKEYLRSKEIRKAILNSAKVDVTALFIAGIIIINILEDFLTGNVWETLISSYVGIGIIIYCAVIMLITIYMIFWR